MMAEVEGHFFEGPMNQKCPRYSVTDFDSGVFRFAFIYVNTFVFQKMLFQSQHSNSVFLPRTVGEIFAASLAQGGPAPSFLNPWAYSYVCNGNIDHACLRSDMVADLQLQSLIEQVFHW